MVTPKVAEKPKRPRTYNVRVPVPNWEQYTEQDKAPAVFKTTDWTFAPGLGFIPPDTMVFLQVVKDRNYDY